MSTINNIKRVLALVVALFSLSMAYATDSNTEATAEWKRGLDAYSNGEYGTARDAWERVAQLGSCGAELYYNLANAYFRIGQQGDAPFSNGELGRTVLNYRRALAIDPADVDARYNLDIAVDYTNDTESLPEGVLSTMWVAVRSVMSSNGWAIASVLQLVMVLALSLIYLLSNSIMLRKIAFFVVILLVVAFIFSTAFAISGRTQAEESREAVVVCNSTTTVHASPDNTSKVIRQPSQGVTVKVLRSHGEWSEIEFADGEKGWIPSSIIEMV